MPGARRGSPWRAPSGHMARGSHMCDPYGVADEGKPPEPAFTCVCRDSGGQRETTGTGIHVRVPEQWWAKENHRNRHSRACAGTVVGKGEPPEPAFTCVCRNSGGQRRTTGTGIHVRVAEQRRAKENLRNRHSCACGGTAAGKGEAPEPAYMCVWRNSGGQRRTSGTGIHVRVPEQRRAKENRRNRHTRACAGIVTGKRKPPEPLRLRGLSLWLLGGAFHQVSPAAEAAGRLRRQAIRTASSATTMSESGLAASIALALVSSVIPLTPSNLIRLVVAAPLSSWI